MRPTEEVVFVQSDELTVADPEFRGAIEDVVDRISAVQYVENVTSPLTGDSEVSADGHAALVQFEIAGDSTETSDRVDPTLAAVAAAQRAHPDLDIEQFGGASADKAIDAVINDDLKKAGMLSLPITLIILTITFGTLRGGRCAAADRDHFRDGRPRPGRDHEPSLPAPTPTSPRSSCDRPGGRCRLLALLPPA